MGYLLVREWFEFKVFRKGLQMYLSEGVNNKDRQQA